MASDKLILYRKRRLGTQEDNSLDLVCNDVQSFNNDLRPIDVYGAHYKKYNDVSLTKERLGGINLSAERSKSIKPNDTSIFILK